MVMNRLWLSAQAFDIPITWLERIFIAKESCHETAR
jgi:hypothetical protein